MTADMTPLIEWLLIKLSKVNGQAARMDMSLQLTEWRPLTSTNCWWQ